MKLSKIYKEILNEGVLFVESMEDDIGDCDCCKYFDFSHSQAGAYYGGLKHPIYHEIEKGIRHQLKYIDPKQYIYAIARGFGGLSYEDVVESGAVSKEKIKEYAEKMKNGVEFPIGYYTQNGGGQEGRHRALATMSLGCNKIPVVLFTDVSQNEAKQLAISYKDFSREYLDDIYKNKGYDGISDLDWRTLRNYIDYRL